ncbi:hypothetical protein B0H19DRAFT_1075764 [Mycena capillaripes]|nr:hypothetical protein B0H19DRAFT_1075764 [Mycena capillaripes]
MSDLDLGGEGLLALLSEVGGGRRRTWRRGSKQDSEDRLRDDTKAGARSALHPPTCIMGIVPAQEIRLTGSAHRSHSRSCTHYLPIAFAAQKQRILGLVHAAEMALGRGVVRASPMYIAPRLCASSHQRILRVTTMSSAVDGQRYMALPTTGVVLTSRPNSTPALPKPSVCFPVRLREASAASPSGPPPRKGK